MTFARFARNPPSSGERKPRGRVEFTAGDRGLERVKATALCPRHTRHSASAAKPKEGHRPKACVGVPHPCQENRQHCSKLHIISTKSRIHTPIFFPLNPSTPFLSLGRLSSGSTSSRYLRLPLWPQTTPIRFFLLSFAPTVHPQSHSQPQPSTSQPQSTTP